MSRSGRQSGAAAPGPPVGKAKEVTHEMVGGRWEVKGRPRWWALGPLRDTAHACLCTRACCAFVSLGAGDGVPFQDWE